MPRRFLLLLVAAALWCGALVRGPDRDAAAGLDAIASIDSGADADLDLDAVPPAPAEPVLASAPDRAPLLAPPPAPTGRAHVSTVFRPPRTHA